jgi:hypothetical protein
LKNDLKLSSKVPAKYKKKHFFNLFAFRRSMMKIEGSGSESGSISQRRGSGSTSKCHGSATLENSFQFVGSISIRFLTTPSHVSEMFKELNQLFEFQPKPISSR